MKIIVNVVFLFLTLCCHAQSKVTKTLKDFGAKGDGKTDDMPAFIKASAFFNARKGNGTLIISKGEYKVHTQKINPKKGGTYYLKHDLLEFIECSNLKIIGEGNPVIKFIEGQRFGSFHPETGKIFNPKMPFIDFNYRIAIGNVINLERCNDVQIENIEGYGNITKMLIGGTWGDVGHQVGHCGIVLGTSYNITIKNVKFTHFGLDGILIVNAERKQKGKRLKDNIVIKNAICEYNGRQGLSWVGGYGLEVYDSKFNHTGKNGKISSPPGAGMDIEQEASLLKDGKFINCEFINNTGVGVVADAGESEDMVFDDCTFWGTTAWSIWTRKTNYVFKNSRIYGSIVHANAGKTNYEATKFYNCTFENKPYKGKPAYGSFLVEYNFIDRAKFEECTFNARDGVMPIWIDNKEKDESTAIVFKECTINLIVDESKKYEYPSVLRNVVLEKTEFNITQNKENTLKKMNFYPINTVRMKKSKIKFSDKKEYEMPQKR